LERKGYFDEVLAGLPQGTWIATGHQADDLAETLLWRILTGSSGTHGAGILPVEGREVRLALTTSRQELREFLTEEGIGWREDSTNSEGRLLRSRIRTQLVPALNQLFPRWADHLGQAALKLPPPADGPSEVVSILAQLLGSSGIRARRAHWEEIQKAQQLKKTLSLDIEGGWKLTHEWNPARERSRWTLE
jgi:tRNA(Ile)-lysidine synthase TilS/MesJ